MGTWGGGYHIYIYIYIPYTHTHYTYIHTYIHTYLHTYILTYLHTYMHASMHPCMHTCMRTYMHAYMHACIHAYMHTAIHAYMHATIHMYTYTYTYTYTCARILICLHMYKHKLYPSTLRNQHPRKAIMNLKSLVLRQELLPKLGGLHQTRVYGLGPRKVFRWLRSYGALVYIIERVFCGTRKYDYRRYCQFISYALRTSWLFPYHSFIADPAVQALSPELWASRESPESVMTQAPYTFGIGSGQRLYQCRMPYITQNKHRLFKFAKLSYVSLHVYLCIYTWV